MKSLRIAIFACSVFLCLSRVGVTQELVGSTTLDIDPDTGTVTATCVTYADADTQAYYRAEIHCWVYDDSNNRVAAGNYVDNSGLGYAQVVLTFTGIPGTTYTAHGSHVALAVFNEELYSPQGDPIFLGYDDAYNFGFFAGNPQTYEDTYDWYGPGPDTPRHAPTQTTGTTTAIATFQSCPTTITVSNTLARSLPSLDHPDSLTGIGILTRMLVSPSVSDYTGVQIRELVTAGPNSCPANIVSYTNFPNLVSTFTVGASAYWEGAPFPSVLNSFYDQHVFYFNFDVLGLTSVSSCTATATLVYSCNGQTIGTFTLTNTYNHGSLSGQSVTNITTTKQ